MASTPDMYLDEIQEQLEVRRDVIVSTASVWKALKRTSAMSDFFPRESIARIANIPNDIASIAPITTTVLDIALPSIYPF
jgi:hypothetical protein